MRYYPGYGLAQESETFADMRMRAEETRRHNERVEKLYNHCENQRKRPMQSMVDWATERGIYESNAQVKTRRDEA